MLTLLPNEQEPHEDSYTRQLEARVQALEKEIKAMREAFGGEIKSLREALRRTTEPLPNVAAPVSSHSTTTSSTSTSSNNSSIERSNSFRANPSVNDQAVTAVKEADSLVDDMWLSIMTESNARYDLEQSIGVVDDRSCHGITVEEAEYRVLVNKEKFEEASRSVPATIQSTKERMAELQEAVGENGDPSGNVAPDVPVTAIGKVYRLLDEFQRDVKANEDSKLLREKKLGLRSNLEWCKVRLQRAQQALEKKRCTSSSPQGASRSVTPISP